MTSIDSALLPNHNKSRSRKKPLSNAELLLSIGAVCATHGEPNPMSCSGNLHVGLFFDGTGNNRSSTCNN